MEDKMRYFKEPEAVEFTIRSLPTAFIKLLISFLTIPMLEYAKWLIGISEHFDLFSNLSSFILYLIFAFFFTMLFLKGYVSTYHKMQQTPFIVITEEGMCLEMELLPYVIGLGRTDKIKIEWSALDKIEEKRNKLEFLFKKGKKAKSTIADLAWMKEKENLLVTLESECRRRQINYSVDKNKISGKHLSELSIN
ncbi:MAG: hypothetical protein HXS44_10660 [Theionarchaea archaeon]|nr:hypothetical protein [Theionarchaea archaeon]